MLFGRALDFMKLLIFFMSIRFIHWDFLFPQLKAKNDHNSSVEALTCSEDIVTVTWFDVRPNVFLLTSCNVTFSNSLVAYTPNQTATFACWCPWCWRSKCRIKSWHWVDFHRKKKKKERNLEQNMKSNVLLKDTENCWILFVLQIKM